MAVETLSIPVPNDCEETAKYLEDLAAQARAGDFIGFYGILVRPGGGWRKTGYIPHHGSAAELIGYLFTAMCDIASETVIPVK